MGFVLNGLGMMNLVEVFCLVECGVIKFKEVFNLDNVLIIVFVDV